MSEAAAGSSVRATPERRIHPALILLVIFLLFSGVLVGSGQSLIDSLDAAMDSPVTWVVALLIGGLGFCGWWVRRTGVRAARGVESAARELSEIRANHYHREGITKEALDKMSRRVPAAHSRGMFGEQWAEFVESLILRDGRYFNTMEAGRFFSDDDFETSVKAHWRLRGFDISLPYSFLHELPNLMTSLGMLGTFVGIAIGLGQLDGVGGDKAKMADEIGGVIGGLASAFWTSILARISHQEERRTGH